MSAELDKLPKVPAPSIKPITQATPPPDIADKQFSAMEDFDVQQLPEQGSGKAAEEGETTTTSKTSPAGAGTETLEASVAAESPRAAKRAPETRPQETSEREVEASEASSDAEVAEESADSTKVEEKKLPKFLKPPKGKETEVKTGAETSVKPIVPKVGARDYSGFTPEEASVAKQMSNDAFTAYKKVVATAKELSTLKDQTVYQHPQAYVLDPTYQQTRTDLTFAQKEASYWEQQLVNMDAGQELVPITGFNAQTGQPIVGQPLKPSKALEEKVRMMIHNCYQGAQQLQGKLSEYPTKYQQTIQTDLQGIEAYRKQQFGWVNDPALLDYSVPVEGLGDRTLKQVREDVVNILPRWMQSHPLTPVIGDLVIALRLKQAELAEALSTQAVSQVKKEEQELVEPSSKDKPSSRGSKGKVHGVEEFVIDPNLGV